MTETKNNLMEKPADRTLKLTRVFNAPRRLVFEACTKKEHIDQWMCPNGFSMHSSNADLREGGKWHSLMISSDGKRYPHGGIYEKIVPDELLVFTDAWEDDDGRPEHWTTVTMRFEDDGDRRTKLMIEHSIFTSVESRKVHEGGWMECLDKLGALLTERQAG
jgi:uncharacterized protein YndB with AHSA1/START domain